MGAVVGSDHHVTVVAVRAADDDEVLAITFRLLDQQRDTGLDRGFFGGELLGTAADFLTASHTGRVVEVGSGDGEHGVVSFLVGVGLF